MSEQRTEQWHNDRLGMVTGSRIADVMAKGKGGAESATRKNYMMELLLHRLTGERQEHYQSPEMLRGIEKEPEAIREYELETFNLVTACGFIPCAEIPRSGGSPDGLVGDDGMIEVKCPNTATHLDTLLTKKIKSGYILQMQFYMLCTGRSWCDFVSYDDRMPDNLKTCIIRVERDEKVLTEIKEEVKKFLAELEELETK